MAAIKDDSIYLAASAATARLRWQRLILLIVLAYEGAGALLGGSLLIIAPDGRLMNMPVTIMHGTFSDFLIPGVILFALGTLAVMALISVQQRDGAEWVMASMAIGALTIWFWIEIAILQELHWLHAMWGLPVVAGGAMIIPLFPGRILKKALLVCGIVSSLLYAVICIIVPLQWPAYSSSSQTISELSAVNAPTRMLWIILSAPCSVLVVAFAVGIWQSFRNHRYLRIGGILLALYGAMSMVWPFVPMHLREVLAAGGASITDQFHIALAVVTELIFLTSLVLFAIALAPSFRIYSIFTFIVLSIFGYLTFREAPRIAVNLPTPMIGVWERVNIGVFLLWMAVLAIVLIRRNTAETRAS
ncbi:MAG: DUF998 domain-containing protein [Agriterribacter sp.]